MRIGEVVLPTEFRIESVRLSKSLVVGKDAEIQKRGGTFVLRNREGPRSADF